MSDLHDLCAPYALDALDSWERARFEAHLEECETCRDEVAGFTETAARMGAAWTEPAAPPALRERILAQAAATPQERVVRVATPARWRRVVPRVAVAAALVAAIAGVAGYVVEHQRVEDERDRSTAMAAVIGAPDAQTMAKTFSNGGTVRLVMSQSRDSAVVVARQLPAPPKGKVYQVWMVAGDDMRSEGTFSTSGTMVMEGVTKADALAVTVEPDGGSDQPTSDPVIKIPV